MGSTASLDRSPRANWLESSGGHLPPYVRSVARSIERKRGVPLSQAIALAIGAMKRWSAGGGDVNADTRAKAAKAVAQWEAAKAKNRARAVSASNPEGGEVRTVDLASGASVVTWTSAVTGRVVELARYVRSEAGARRYKRPIGALIEPGRGRALGATTPTAARKAAAKGASAGGGKPAAKAAPKAPKRGADYVREALAAREKRETAKVARHKGKTDGQLRAEQKTAARAWLSGKADGLAPTDPKQRARKAEANAIGAELTRRGQASNASKPSGVGASATAADRIARSKSPGPDARAMSDADLKTAAAELRSRQAATGKPSAALKVVQAEQSRRGGKDPFANFDRGAEGNRAAADKVEKATKGTAGEAAGKRNADDLRGGKPPLRDMSDAELRAADKRAQGGDRSGWSVGDISIEEQRRQQAWERETGRPDSYARSPVTANGQRLPRVVQRTRRPGSIYGPDAPSAPPATPAPRTPDVGGAGGADRSKLPARSGQQLDGIQRRARDEVRNGDGGARTRDAQQTAKAVSDERNRRRDTPTPAAPKGIVTGSPDRPGARAANRITATQGAKARRDYAAGLSDAELRDADAELGRRATALGKGDQIGPQRKIVQDEIGRRKGDETVSIGRDTTSPKATGWKQPPEDKTTDAEIAAMGEALAARRKANTAAKTAPGAGNPKPTTSPGARPNAGPVTKARDAVTDGDTDRLAQALEDAKVPDPERAADRIISMTGSARSKQVVAERLIARHDGMAKTIAPATPQGPRTPAPTVPRPKPVLADLPGDDDQDGDAFARRTGDAARKRRTEQEKAAAANPAPAPAPAAPAAKPNPLADLTDAELKERFDRERGMSRGPGTLSRERAALVAEQRRRIAAKPTPAFKPVTGQFEAAKLQPGNRIGWRNIDGAQTGTVKAGTGRGYVVRADSGPRAGQDVEVIVPDITGEAKPTGQPSAAKAQTTRRGLEQAEASAAANRAVPAATPPQATSTLGTRRGGTTQGRIPDRRGTRFYPATGPAVPAQRAEPTAAQRAEASANFRAEQARKQAKPAGSDKTPAPVQSEAELRAAAKGGSAVAKMKLAKLEAERAGGNIADGLPDQVAAPGSDARKQGRLTGGEIADLQSQLARETDPARKAALRRRIVAGRTGAVTTSNPRTRADVELAMGKPNPFAGKKAAPFGSKTAAPAFGGKTGAAATPKGGGLSDLTDDQLDAMIAKAKARAAGQTGTAAQKSAQAMVKLKAEKQSRGAGSKSSKPPWVKTSNPAGGAVELSQRAGDTRGRAAQIVASSGLDTLR